MISLKADKISKSYNDNYIFKNINIEATKGDIFGISGANGSGKTTLIKILSCLLPPTSGAVSYFYNEKISCKTTFQENQIVSPEINIYETMNTKELINFAFYGDEEKIKRSIEILLLFEMDFNNKKSITDFSAGMKQKIKLSLAFSSCSPFLFLDEPGWGLDEKSRNILYSLITENSSETITFIASNDKEEMKLCNRSLSLG